MKRTHPDDGSIVTELLDALPEVQEFRRAEEFKRTEEARKRQGTSRSAKRAALKAQRATKMRPRTHTITDCGNPGCARCGE